MKKSLLIGLSVGVPIILIGFLVVHVFFYPLVSVSPNYADVEAVYNKMVVPETWVKKGEGANKGLAGRRCPAFESDGCFSKAGTFTVMADTPHDEIMTVFKSMGCPSVYDFRRETIGGNPSTSYECSIYNGVKISGSLQESSKTSWEMYINVGSR